MHPTSCTACLTRKAFLASLALQGAAALLLALGACGECGLGPPALPLLPGSVGPWPGRLLPGLFEGGAAFLLLAPAAPAPGALLGLLLGSTAVLARLSGAGDPVTLLPGALLLAASGAVLLVRLRQLPRLAGRPMGRIPDRGSGHGEE